MRGPQALRFGAQGGARVGPRRWFAGRRARATLAVLVAGAAAASRATADPPSPLDPARFSFPGSVANPASAASAGLALADRWLGEQPFSNPAVALHRHASGSGTLLRVSRQDLRAANRRYDETAAFLDGASLAVGLPARGRLAVALYAFQPVLRREEAAYTRGTGTPDPANPPAVVQANASMRELRAGLAIASSVGPARAGLGLEWTGRRDLYRLVEQSGAPEAGARRLEIAGNGMSAQLGVRLDRGAEARGALSIGAGARYLPGLALEAIHSETLLVGTTHETLRARRGSGWEGGVTGRVVVSPGFRVLVALGGRTAQRWDGFDLEAGRAWEWKLAGELHDARDPWTVRLGLGQERQAGAPEPRADVLSLGFGWRFTDFALEVGILHRTLARAGSPDSYDDRLVVTARAPR